MASSALGNVLLIPCYLDEEVLETIPAYILPAVQSCQAFFVENERTSRRYLKRIWKEMVIDQYDWFAIHQLEEATIESFRQQLKRGKTIGILSEAGCPGVADPGQLLVAAAQDMGAIVKPLVGPSSILLALMASGMNGQQFRFLGYLPIDTAQRIKQIRELEAAAAKDQCTQIFIETPYRNNQLFESLLAHCKATTRICVAVDISSSREEIRTKTVQEWKKFKPDWHKRPAIFLLLA